MLIDELRRHYHVRDGYWFAPKLYGYGATPVTWQGWALTAGFVAVVTLVAMLLHHPVAVIAVALALTVPFMALVYAKTDGGWTWRWGPDR